MKKFLIALLLLGLCGCSDVQTADNVESTTETQDSEEKVDLGTDSIVEDENLDLYKNEIISIRRAMYADPSVDFDTKFSYLPGNMLYFLRNIQLVNETTLVVPRGLFYANSLVSDGEILADVLEGDNVQSQVISDVGMIVYLNDTTVSSICDSVKSILSERSDEWADAYDYVTDIRFSSDYSRVTIVTTLEGDCEELSNLALMMTPYYYEYCLEYNVLKGDFNKRILVNIIGENGETLVSNSLEGMEGFDE